MNLPDDLKNFHAARSTGEYVFAALAFSLWVWAMFLPDVKPAAPVAVAAPAPVVSRELACDCPKMNREREWLRLQVAHKADRYGCTVVCEYGRVYLLANDL